jgi:hypothetical protein
VSAMCVFEGGICKLVLATCQLFGNRASWRLARVSACTGNLGEAVNKVQLRTARTVLCQGTLRVQNWWWQTQ